MTPQLGGQSFISQSLGGRLAPPAEFLLAAHTRRSGQQALTREPTTIPLLSSMIVHALYCTSVCRMPRASTCLSAHARVCPSACVRRPVSVGSHKGLEARAFRALPLLCAKRLRLLQLIYIPNNVMATQREGHFLWISFLAIDVTSHLEREVGRGVRRNRRALDTARTLAELRAGHEQMAASSRECRPHGLDT